MVVFIDSSSVQRNSVSHNANANSVVRLGYGTIGQTISTYRRKSSRERTVRRMAATKQSNHAGKERAQYVKRRSSAAAGQR